jgi:hypothetical protein
MRTLNKWVLSLMHQLEKLNEKEKLWSNCDTEYPAL